MSTNILPSLDALCDATLPYVPFDGWTEAVLIHGLADLGAPAAVIPLLCPEGPKTILHRWCRQGDEALIATSNAPSQAASLSTMKIRDRIAQLVMTRIGWHHRHKEATRRLIAFYLHPSHMVEGQKSLWETVDCIWRLAGDQSTDFNYYTKRGLLEYVYSTSLLFWLDDDSKEYAASDAFLRRRIQEVLTLGGQCKDMPQKARAVVKKIPILRFLLPKKA